MRIKYIVLTIATVLTMAFQSAQAQETETPVVTSSSTWEDIVSQLGSNTSTSNVIRDIALNNEGFLGDALAYLATNNPEALIGAMQAIRENAPSLAASAFATVSQLLADNGDLLQELQDANPELVAQILNGNIDVLPAAGPRARNDIRNGARDRLAIRRATAENARQSSPN